MILIITITARNNETISNDNDIDKSNNSDFNPICYCGICIDVPVVNCHHQISIMEREQNFCFTGYACINKISSLE